MNQSFNYEATKKYLESLFNQENINLEVQCCYSVLYMMLYEHAKFMLLNQIIYFFMDDLIPIDKPQKSKKYIELYQNAGGSFEYAYEFYELNDEQRKLLKKAQSRRGKATHEFLNFFITEKHFSSKELSKLYDVVKYIDNYWAINIEIPISGGVDMETADLESAHSVQFLLIEAVAKRFFLLDKAVKKENAKRTAK